MSHPRPHRRRTSFLRLPTAVELSQSNRGSPKTAQARRGRRSLRDRGFCSLGSGPREAHEAAEEDGISENEESPHHGWVSYFLFPLLVFLPLLFGFLFPDSSCHLALTHILSLLCRAALEVAMTGPTGDAPVQPPTAEVVAPPPTQEIRVATPPPSHPAPSHMGCARARSGHTRLFTKVAIK